MEAKCWGEIQSAGHKRFHEAVVQGKKLIMKKKSNSNDILHKI